MLTITSGHPSSEYNLKRKLKAKLSPSNQIFEQPEEELMDFMEQKHHELKHIE